MRELINISLSARDKAQITDYQEANTKVKACMKGLEKVLSMKPTPRSRSKASLDSRYLDDSKLPVIPQDVTSPN